MMIWNGPTVEDREPPQRLGAARRLGRALPVITALMVLWLPLTVRAEPVHTPVPGSPERKQIADAMRVFVKAHKAPKPVVFKIDQIRVSGSYCYFEGFALYADGSHVPENVLPDVVYNTFLKRERGKWRVIHDLTRTDVPSESEIKDLRRNFPAEIPRQLVPPFWRDLLKL